MKICHHCQKKFFDEFSFCPTCGKPLEEEQKVIFCPYCGEALAGEKICPKCHHSLDLNPNPSTNSSQTKVVSDKQPFRISCSMISAFLGLLIAFLSLVFIFIPCVKLTVLENSENKGIIFFLTDLLDAKESFEVPIYFSFAFSILTLLVLVVSLVFAIIYFIKSFSSTRYTRHTLSMALISVLAFFAFYYYQKIYLFSSAISLSTAGIIYIILSILILISAIVCYCYYNYKKINWTVYSMRLIIGILGCLFIVLSFAFLATKAYDLSYDITYRTEYYTDNLTLTFSSISIIYGDLKTWGTALYAISPLYIILGFMMMYFFIQLFFEFQSPSKSLKLVGSIMVGLFIIFSIAQFVLIILSTTQLFDLVIEDIYNVELPSEITIDSSLTFAYSILSLVFNILVCCAWYVWMILEKKLGKPKQQTIQNQTV